MGMGENLSKGKIAEESFKKVALLSIIVTLGYVIFTILSRNNSDFNFISDLGVPIINSATLIILFYAAKRSKLYGRNYYLAWMMLLASQVFWVMGDVSWLIASLNLNNSLFLSVVYIFFTFRTVCLCLGVYLLPKPQLDVFILYRRVVEIAMVLVTITMFFWSFLIAPFIGINQISSFNYLVLSLDIISLFVTIFFAIFLFVSYAGNLKKGPVPYILFSILFQVVAAIIFVYEFIIHLNPTGGIENIFWIAGSLSMLLAGLVQISIQPPEVLQDFSTDFWRFKFPLETNFALILAGVAYLLLLWDYNNNKQVFEVLLYVGGVLVALAILRAVVNNREVQKSYKKLEESKTSYKSILNTINDAVYVISPEIKFLEVNQGALDMYGYSSSEILGETLEMLSAPGKNDMEKVIEAGYRALDGEHQTFEFLGQRKNGEIFSKEIKLNKGIYFGQDVVVAVARDITGRKEVEKRLKRSLDEKEALLQEVHHRVKNNMQVISSLLGLQSMYMDDNNVQSVLLESQNRVQSMAMVHEKLYNSENLSSIDMGEYMHEITHYLINNYQLDSKEIKTIILAENAEMNIKTAAPMGLIINELLTNSLKYAFPNGKGKICLKLSLIDDCYHLIVADNGIGLPHDFQLDKTETLGLLLVNRMVRQIGGSIEFLEGEGTQFLIKFPCTHPEGNIDNKGW
jgi:two-component system, sensor histidine kinase PdtaS